MMKNPNIKSLWIVGVLFFFILGIGCASKEEKKEKHLKRARQYIEKKEYKAAVIELRNVVKLDPENDAAYRELGETYLKLKQVKEAFQSYAHAVSINPNNLSAQLKMGRIFLLAKKNKEAKEKATSELNKLKLMSPMSAEATVVRNYVDWLVKAPWKKRSKVFKDLKKAEAVLEADLLLDFDFQNGPDSVVLRSPSGEVIDALSYGVFGPTDVLAGEGAPAPDPAAGRSLARRFANLDTDDNARDFEILASPTPGFGPTQVPEPTRGALLMAALAAWLCARRTTRAVLQLASRWF